MQRFLLSAVLLSLLLLPTACITSEEYTTTPRGNFDALWQIIDEHYCFFDYKRQEYGLDWQEVRQRYAPQVHSSMSQRALFQVLGRMCNELRDGHVNLWAPFDVARYADWYENYPANFSDSLNRITLGRVGEYQTTNGLSYRVLRNNIGYIRCATFTGGIGTGGMHEIMRYLSTCDALIVDVRNNGGGMLTSAEALAASFCNQTTTVGYIVHKTGKGHSDFSTPKSIRLRPAPGLRWQKPVAVLTNRRTYSAANSFAMYMRTLPGVVLVGDRTGGGSGMPFSSELPGGWSIRFSASPIYDARMQHTEFGIDPDIKVNISPDDYQRGVDTILERAIDHLAHTATNPTNPTPTDKTLCPSSETISPSHETFSPSRK